MWGNMSDKNTSGGIGTVGLLGVAFVVLKLTHVIDWSWWYVTMPFWIGFPLVAGFFIIAFVCISVMHVYDKWKSGA